MTISAVRVTRRMLSRATVRLQVDVSVGDPISPEPQHVSLPRLLDGVLQVRGYPLEMALAEKIATAIARGTAQYPVARLRGPGYAAPSKRRHSPALRGSSLHNIKK